MTGSELLDAHERDGLAEELIRRADLDSARAAIAGLALRTPTIPSPALLDASTGASADGAARGRSLLKAECLQVAGSFKIRGALSRLAALGEEAEAGLVTASAGNHARAVAQAARSNGLECEVFMPLDAPVSKVLAVEALGARVRLGGSTVEEALERAGEASSASGAAFVHPFDDLDVIAGQATLGLELIEDVPDLARVVVPVGGGGLASGIGIALRRAGVRAQLIGVQAELCAPFLDALGRGTATELSETTIADGVAVKRPGRLTLPLLAELLDDLVTVSEDQIADAMVFLAERAKLVAEGAGAVAVAALLAGLLPPVDGATVAVVSGGNVDSALLASLLLRHEAEEGRRVRIHTRVPDRPGGLAELLGLIARARANVVSVEHLREAVPLHPRETAVELTLETRGRGHTEELMATLAAGGYEARFD
ncbi:MAG TPA: threonine ammonia-lyase [Solirubrobacteraceae bacterium]|jgi:threonine dehydratase|nr:threonine ammonia-lyase [Solirubrobacteraceae bacterium]